MRNLYVASGCISHLMLFIKVTFIGVHSLCCTCHVSVAVTPVVTLPSTTVATSVESIQQRLLVQLAQSSTQPGAARPAISVIQLRPGSTTAPPTTLAFPSPLTIRSGQPLTLVAAPTTSGVRLNQVFSMTVLLSVQVIVTFLQLLC